MQTRMTNRRDTVDKHAALPEISEKKPVFWIPRV